MSWYKSSPQSPPMFKNRFLDALTRTPVWVVPIIYLPICALLFIRGAFVEGVGVGLSFLMASLGYIAWTLSEYWLHRLFFHWQPATRWGPRFHYFAHGVHHEHPNDRYRLVMPVPISAILCIAFLGVWLALMGRYGWPFHAGFVLGYLYYDLTHYYVHHGRPKRNHFKKLRRHHLSHHFNKIYQDRRYGVSTRVWDKVFKTMRAG